MIPLKTEKEIGTMADGGKRLGWVLAEVLKKVKPGVSLRELDQLAEKLIKKKGGKPSFKMVEGYRWATFLNVDQGVVHGVPTDYLLKKGDLLSIDLGLFYQGFHTDMARTIQVAGGKNQPFLKAGKKALREAIKATKPGNRVGHLSAAIEKEIRKAGYQPVRTLTGHGVGKELHEEPRIPCFLERKLNETLLLKPGMVLAIEVIYTKGKPDLLVKDDGWTVETIDSKLAGLFEQTVAVTKKGPKVLTPYLAYA